MMMMYMNTNANNNYINNNNSGICSTELTNNSFSNLKFTIHFLYKFLTKFYLIMSLYFILSIIGVYGKRIQVTGKIWCLYFYLTVLITSRNPVRPLSKTYTHYNLYVYLKWVVKIKIIYTNYLFHVHIATSNVRTNFNMVLTLIRIMSNEVTSFLCKSIKGTQGLFLKDHFMWLR